MISTVSQKITKLTLVILLSSLFIFSATKRTYAIFCCTPTPCSPATAPYPCCRIETGSCDAGSPPACTGACQPNPAYGRTPGRNAGPDGCNKQCDADNRGGGCNDSWNRPGEYCTWDYADFGGPGGSFICSSSTCKRIVEDQCQRQTDATACANAPDEANWNLKGCKWYSTTECGPNSSCIYPNLGGTCGQGACTNVCGEYITATSCNAACTYTHKACGGTTCSTVNCNPTTSSCPDTCTTGAITWPGTVTPYPATGATNVSVNPILTWTNVSSWGDSCATTHTYNLYLKKQGAANYTVTNLVGNSSTQSNLEHATTYQWYVVPQNNNGTGPASSVWTFTTVPLSWFQVSGGDVYAKTIINPIPATYGSACQRYINLNQ